MTAQVLIQSQQTLRILWPMTQLPRLMLMIRVLRWLLKMADDASAGDGTDDARDTEGTQFTSSKSGIIQSDGHFAKKEGQLLYAASEGMYHSVMLLVLAQTILVRAQA